MIWLNKYLYYVPSWGRMVERLASTEEIEPYTVA